MAAKSKKLFTILGGLAVGLVNGLLGAGGGMLAVPLLRKSGLSQQEAHAGSLAVILPLSIFSAILYLTAGRVTLADAAGYLPGGLAGAVAGALLLRKIPDRWLRRIFALFMIWAGVRLFLR